VDDSQTVKRYSAGTSSAALASSDQQTKLDSGTSSAQHEYHRQRWRALLRSALWSLALTYATAAHSQVTAQRLTDSRRPQKPATDVANAPTAALPRTLTPDKPRSHLSLDEITTVLMSGEPVVILPDGLYDDETENLLCAKYGWAGPRLVIEFDGRCLHGFREYEVAIQCFRSGRPGQCVDGEAKSALRMRLTDRCAELARRLERVAWPTGVTTANIPAWAMTLRVDGTQLEVERPGKNSVTLPLRDSSLPTALYYWPASHRLVIRVVAPGKSRRTDCLEIPLS
jgi:hypothetical protein